MRKLNKDDEVDSENLKAELKKVRISKESKNSSDQESAVERKKRLMN